MDFGIFAHLTDYSIDAVEVAQACEERGFGSLFFPDHSHIPASRQTPWPGGPDQELPREYSHTPDPFVALAAAAAVTQKIRLGTGVCLVIERDPIVLAKEVASLDHISGGRVDFGIGGGWNREEMENHGTDYRTRWKLLRERVEAMKAIWTQDEASYEGEFVKFEKIWSWPKPVQKPHPPIIVGGDGARTFQRVVRYGDEWMPINRGPHMLEVIGGKIKTLQGMASEAGRGPIPVTLFGAPPEAARIEALHGQGITRFVFRVGALPSAAALTLLDEYAAVIEELA